MSEKLSVFLKKYLILILFCCVFAGVYMASKWGTAADLKDKYKVISDGLAVPGILILCYGLLAWIYAQGVMDGFLYMVDRAKAAIIPGAKIKVPEYAEFIEKKNETRQKDFIQFLIVGGAFVALSLVFVLLYNGAA